MGAARKMPVTMWGVSNHCHLSVRSALGRRPLARAGRGHWDVENKLYWTLDAWFREDPSRACSGFAAENLAPLRRLALNLLKQEKTKNAASAVNNSAPVGITPLCSAVTKFDASALRRSRRKPEATGGLTRISRMNLNSNSPGNF
jgi:hypothetical protein